MKKDFLFFIACATIVKLSIADVVAQNQRLVDSLQLQLKRHNIQKFELGRSVPALYDTTAAKILYDLSKAYWNNNLDKAIDYAKQSLALSEQIGYQKGMSNAYNGLGIFYYVKGDYFPAVEFHKKALKIREGIGDKKGIAGSYNNIGEVYRKQGNYPEALKNYLACLKMSEVIGYKNGIATNYNNIGIIYEEQANYPEALKYQFASLKIAEEIGDTNGIALSYGNIGNIYQEQGNCREALKYQFASLRIDEEIADKNGIARSYNNIGAIYNEQENFPEALKYQFASLKIDEEIGDKLGIVRSYNNIGGIYTQEKKYNEASEYLNKALSLAKEIGSLYDTRLSYDNLAQLDSAQGNFNKALEHYKLYIIIRDSLMNNEKTKKITQLEMQYEFDKKESAAKAEQDKKDTLTNAEIYKQKIIRNFSVAGAAGILFLGGFVFYNFRKRKKLESQQALSNERLRISRELHDDIGSTLGSIAVYSDVAKNRSGKNETPVEVLSKIGSASRELIEKMSDIVWSLNPDNETFEQLKNRMQGFAAMILTPRNIAIEFKADDELKYLQLTSEQRKNVFLIYKEAVHNIIKYAECKNVFISLTKPGNNLILVIRDDGKGFDSLSIGDGRGGAYNGNGLTNIKARAVDIGAVLNIISKTNEGTAIELAIPV